MQTTKQKTIDAIQTLPDDASFDDIILQIAYIMRDVQPMSIEEFNRRIDQSEADFEAGNFIEAEKLLDEVGTWT